MTLRTAAGLVFLLACSAPARAGAAQAQPGADATPRFALRQAQLERDAVGAGRFRVKARLAPVETPGERRERGDFVLIGRLSKAGAAACGSDTLFRNGFEGG
jgi:hypothetical protein